MPRTLSWLLMAVALQCSVRAEPVPGDRVGPFALPAYGGELFRWQPGKATVFSFCAFWCDTWKEQNARLAAARRAARGLPVQFLTISVDGRWSERGQGTVGGTVLLDPGGAFSASLGIHAVPYTVVTDARGRVCYAAQGIVGAAALQRSLRDAATRGRPP